MVQTTQVVIKVPREHAPVHGDDEAFDMLGRKLSVMAAECVGVQPDHLVGAEWVVTRGADDIDGLPIPEEGLRVAFEAHREQAKAYLGANPGEMVAVGVIRYLP